jgi:conjugative transfer signal peptidase TraF
MMWGEYDETKARRRGRFLYMMGEMRWLIVAELVIVAMLTTLIFVPRPFLVWNVSASAPVGLYKVGGKADIARGDMVVARVRSGLRMFAARRGYLPLNVPLVKRVVGLPGDKVCAEGASVRVNGKFVATRRALDARQRPMPRWSGCVDMVEGDYFLVMSDNPASFDGRYFGVSNIDDIVGEARLVWRR